MSLNAREDNILDTTQSMGSGEMMGRSIKDCVCSLLQISTMYTSMYRTVSLIKHKILQFLPTSHPSLLQVQVLKFQPSLHWKAVSSPECYIFWLGDQCMKWNPTKSEITCLVHTYCTNTKYSHKSSCWCGRKWFLKVSRHPMYQLHLWSPNEKNTGCFKKSFTTLKVYINVFRGYVQCFEMP
jgi:hypothetical protein